MSRSKHRNPQNIRKATRQTKASTACTLREDFTPPHTTDIAIIGAGASGMAAALMAQSPNISVCIFEKAKTCGTSILKTGNGSCNFSNTVLEGLWYNHPQFVDDVFGDSAPDDILRFFGNLGLMWTTKESRLYPYSLKASSVRDVLVRALSQTHARICANTEVKRVEYIDVHAYSTSPSASVSPHQNMRWKINSHSDGISYDTYARAIIVASGGAHTLSYLSENLPQLSILPFEDMLCPLACAPSPLFELDGTRFRVRLSLIKRNHEIWSEAGEMLVRAWGISGIVVFNASRIAHAGDTLMIDFLPMLGNNEARDLFASRLHNVPSQHTSLTSSLEATCIDMLLGIFDESSAHILGKLAIQQCKGTLQKEDIAEALTNLCKKFTLTVEHATQTQLAQVHRGGVAIEHVEPQTLAHKDVQGLFVCGEALDIDGACGGYNLSWAWLSGIRAGRSACAYLNASSMV